MSESAVLAKPRSVETEEILAHFMNYVESLGVSLYDHQEEAILEILENHNVILNTPTGSGKSMVALASQYRSLCLGRKSYYTVPIKALANEKFLSLCRVLGPENVGMMTGDASVNPAASVICCTAEILSNIALREGELADVGDVIMDEFHYYSDRDRGSAWQIPLLLLPQARFLLMSATLGDTALFEKELAERTGSPCVLVKSDQRPVPLEYEYSEIQLEQKVVELVTEQKAPIYLVHFGQLSAARTAQNLLSWNVCTKEEKNQIRDALIGVNFSSPYGKELSKLLRHGVGIHHAGLLPKYRVLVEKLAQKGLLKVICGTDTLGVGVNVPIRSVMFTQLCKFDGEGTKILTVRDFKQIAGRAGRRGYDDRGYVIAQAPEHVIENIRLETKAAGKAGGKKKVVKKKPPERGYIAWNAETFQKLTESEPEALVSSFHVRQSMLIHLLRREHHDGCTELKTLLENCHESEVQKRAHRRKAWEMFRSMVSGGVFELIAPAQRVNGVKVVLSAKLQENFSMNQALGLYLLDAIGELDQEDPLYTLNVVSLVEAIVENPQTILRNQVHRAKKQLIEELKEDGVSYEERMEALEEVTWPKPGEEFIYQTYQKFLVTHPWVGSENVKPKSIVREMLVNFQSFTDYVREYGLEKNEAILLRHMTEVYKVIEQTVPPAYKSENCLECEAWLKEELESIDSSLLEEWERLRDPNYVPKDLSREKTQSATIPLSRRKKEFERKIRASMMLAIKHLSYERAEDFMACFGSFADTGFHQASLLQWFDLYYQDHQLIALDPEARNLKHWRMKAQGEKLIAEQTLVDPEGLNDWKLVVEVDRTASDQTEEVVMNFQGLEQILT